MTPGSGVPAVRLERHVFGPSASAYDTAWTTLGWTPGIEERTGELEETLPWGASSSGPRGRLSGPADELIGWRNLDDLGYGFLRLGDRFGFTLRGRVGGVDEGRERVLCHTVLLDAPTFFALAGHPAALVAPRGRPAPWFVDLVEGPPFMEPRRLDPIAVPPADWADVWRAELRRLAARASELVGPAATVERLAAVYEGLASVAAGASRHVALRARGDGSASLLVRLAWLSLPPRDRVAVSFLTDHRRSARVRGSLLVLDPAEWEGLVPDETLPADEPDSGAAASAGRRRWAEAVALGPAQPHAFERLFARAVARGWCLVTRDDLTADARLTGWYRRVRGGTPEDVADLYAIERERPGGPRLLALGRALAAAEASEEERVRFLDRVADADRIELGRGLVRGLREERPLEAGRARCALVLEGHGEADRRELRRVLDRERDVVHPLLSDPGGADLLVRAAAASAADGDRIGVELAALAAPVAAWDEKTVDAVSRACSGEAVSSGRAGTSASAATRSGDLAVAVTRSLAAAAPPERVARVVPALLVTAPRDAIAQLAEDLAGLPADAGPAWRVIALPLIEAAARHRVVEAGAAAVRRAAAMLPPDLHADAWTRLLEGVPAAWVAARDVLPALRDALGAGRGPWGGPALEPEPVFLDALLSRALESEASAELLECICRLLWDGAGTAHSVLDEHVGRGAALLARLLISPAPAPLSSEIRRALERGADAPDHGELPADVLEGVARHAPALHEKLTGRAEARVLISEGAR